MMIEQRTLDECRNKKVLHVGALGDWKRFIKENKISDWSYVSIKRVAESVIAIDIDEPGISAMRKRGFDIEYGDIEDLNLKKKFDVIFCGDVIEHLNNIGLFFDSCKRHMHEESVLIISTNNPYSANMIMHSLLGTVHKGIYFDHTTLLYENNILLFAKRYGLDVKSVDYFTLIDYRSKWLVVTSYAIKLLGVLCKSYNTSYNVRLTLGGKRNV